MDLSVPTLPSDHRDALDAYFSSEPNASEAIRLLLLYLGERPAWSFTASLTPIYATMSVSADILDTFDALDLPYEAEYTQNVGIIHSGQSEIGVRHLNEGMDIDVAHNEDVLSLLTAPEAESTAVSDLRQGLCYAYPTNAVAEYIHADGERFFFHNALERGDITDEDYAYIEAYFGGFIPGSNIQTLQMIARRARYFDSVLRTFADTHEYPTLHTLLDGCIEDSYFTPHESKWWHV